MAISEWQQFENDTITLPYINVIDRSQSGSYTLDGIFYEVVFRADDGSINVQSVRCKEEAEKFVAFIKERQNKE